MEDLTDEYMRTVTDLRALAKELKLRSAVKLLQAARGRVAGASLRLATLALEDNVVKQVLARSYPSTRKSAAESPDMRVQTDLVDFAVH